VELVARMEKKIHRDFVLLHLMEKDYLEDLDIVKT